MNLNDTKSSETLRKEISQDLDRLDSKVDHLKGRLTPGQLLDDAIFSRYRGNPRETLQYLKRNPVGSSFLALGAILLMDNEGESYEEFLRSQGRVAYQDYRIKASQVKGDISQRMSHISQEVKSKTQGMMEKGEQGIHLVRERGESIKKQVSSAKDNLTQQLGRKKEEIGQNLSSNASRLGSEVRDNVIDATESFKERSSSYVSSQESSSVSSSDLSTGSSSRMSQMKDSVKDFSRHTMDKVKDAQLDSLGYVALGGTIGFVTGGLVPFSEEELSNVSSEFDFQGLRSELEQAANESLGIFRNEFIDTIKNSSLDIF